MFPDQNAQPQQPPVMPTAAEIPIQPQPMLTVGFMTDEDRYVYISYRLQEYLLYDITESFLVICFFEGSQWFVTNDSLLCDIYKVSINYVTSSKLFFNDV